MTQDNFTAILQSGHKEDAVQVPFDPATQWGVPAQQLWKGRRGHRVRAVLNDEAFESMVVARSKRFYLIVLEHLKTLLGIALGDTVEVAMEPDL